MELRLGNIVSKLVVLLLGSFLGDVGKFISRAHFFLEKISMIFFSGSCEDDHQKIMACKGEEASVVVVAAAEMNSMMNRLGMEGIYGKSSVGEEDVVALFEEEEPSLDEIKETFGVLDANNDGFIDATDLRRIISNLGYNYVVFDLEEYKRMIKAFDTNGDGLIDFQEFVKLMEKCLCN